MHAPRVSDRADKVLDYLEVHGPSVITRIAFALVMATHLIRYALVTLRKEARAHISEFLRLMGADGIPRHVGVFAAGPGEDAVLPFRRDPDELDFITGKHLQPLYCAWARTRHYPDIE
jgi:hypothetical protein